MRKKYENLFVLVIALVGIGGLLCLTGCGSGSCEYVRYGKISEEGVSAVGISLPGCGGCFSSEKGCNSACWPQSVKLIAGAVTEETGDEEAAEEESVYYLGCDNQYYGSCLGCGQAKKSCYSGMFANDINNFACFYGVPNKEEQSCGVIDGCGGCAASDSNGKEAIEMIEYWLGID